MAGETFCRSEPPADDQSEALIKTKLHETMFYIFTEAYKSFNCTCHVQEIDT